MNPAFWRGKRVLLTGHTGFKGAWLALDSGKARARLGWMPRLDLAQSIKWTVEWYKRYLTGSDARELSRAQISSYLQFAA